ncbi:hypothetical protein PENSTE_c031G03255 [Penicillium steckii]|uniref:amidase n=1 Tax=Penicillium steckii TaxID=303698 RepID=A0A1V6SMG8_9EURO|nr:hypothetical protein PENSTE_c031G03255 [Penicillium steckii]
MSAWKEKSLLKRQTCSDKIPVDWKIPTSVQNCLTLPSESSRNNIFDLDLVRKSGILTEREIHITEGFDVTGLLQGLRKGELTAVEVTKAFSKRAAIAHQLVNCLTETYFDEAIKRAEALDKLKISGQVAGPFHGLPISLKDSFQILGSHATLGIVSFLERVSERNSVLVDILTSLGAVVYVKTNVPQTLATVDTDNNIFGRTLNPWNTKLGAGGSSGGEGALVALRGSPLGVGTDVGGSIRIPALCCGTYGFKPSASRIPYSGQQNCGEPGTDFILPCAGPVSNDVNALEIFMKATLDTRPAYLDSGALDLPWRDVSGDIPHSLRIGLIPEDPRFPLHPPVKLAIQEAVKRLQKHGHIIVPLKSTTCHVADATEIAWKIFMFDTETPEHVKSTGEPFIPSVAYTHGIARDLDNQFLTGLDKLDRLSQLAVLRSKQTQIREDWRKSWTENKLDLVLSPSAQSTAVEHDRFGLPAYTTLTNVLDFPSCVIPFLHASSTETYGDFSLKAGQRAPEYKPEDIDGAPTSVQVFTRTFRDEECLFMAKIVDECLKNA